MQLIDAENGYHLLSEMYDREISHFRGFLEREGWWHTEAFRFLKGRSRAISLHNSGVEKELIDAVPHEVICPESRLRTNKPKKKSAPIRTATRPKDEWF